MKNGSYLILFGPILWATLSSFPVMGQEAQKKSPPLAKDIIKADRILIIGHRGASAYAPENTLAAFKLAVAQKADLVEDDYQATQDGKLIVLHDSTVDRTTDAIKKWGEKKILVKTRTLEDLRQLDAGSWKAPKYAGEKLPTFAEAVECMLEGAVPLLERKGGTPEQTLAELKRIDAVEKVVVQSFDWMFLTQLHKLEPKITLGALGSKTKLTDRQIKVIKQTGASVVGWGNGEIDADGVKLVQSAGLRLWAWTVDDEKEIRRLKDLGVNGIITNRPDTTRKVVESQ